MLDNFCGNFDDKLLNDRLLDDNFSDDLDWDLDDNFLREFNRDFEKLGLWGVKFDRRLKELYLLVLDKVGEFENGVNLLLVRLFTWFLIPWCWKLMLLPPFLLVALTLCCTSPQLYIPKNVHFIHFITLATLFIWWYLMHCYYLLLILFLILTTFHPLWNYVLNTWSMF